MNNDVTVLLGQSNCSGEALNSTLPVTITGVLPCKIYSNVRNQWEDLTIGTNQNNSDTPFYTLNSLTLNSYENKHGVEVYLMPMIYEYFNVKPYLLKYGWSGSALQYVLSNGTWNPANVTTGGCFNNAKNKYIAAQSALPNISIKPKRVIYIQGEADTNSPYHVTYKTALPNLIDNLFAVYGQGVDIYIVSLNNNQTALNTLRAKMVTLAQKNTCKYNFTGGIINVNTIVNTKGNCYYIQYQPELKADNVHLSTNGFKDLATVLMSLIKMTAR